MTEAVEDGFGTEFDPTLEEDMRVASELIRQPAAWAVGVVSAFAAIAAGWSLPLPMVVLLGVLGAGLGVLGFIDANTRLILNHHNLVFAIGTVAVLAWVQEESTGIPGIWALVAAAVTFVTMVMLYFLTGFASGGDIKIAPVVAGALAAIHPLIAAFWLLAAFLICAVYMIGKSVLSKSLAQQMTPLAPFMALALPVSVVTVTAMYAQFGMLLTF